MGYLQFDVLPKAVSRQEDLGPGQVILRHLAPALFLELQQIKLHLHTGSDSRQLPPDATPDMVRGYRPKEREEHGAATWSGAASASGSVTIAFGTQFAEVPEVFAIAQEGTANIVLGTNTPTASQVTIYWKDTTAATHTSLVIAWLAKAR